MRQPLQLKYRPQTLAALVGQPLIVTMLTNALQQQKLVPAYLLVGGRGTGKTSCGRILAKSLNCFQSERPTTEPCNTCAACKAITAGNALDVLEIDAASNTGVEKMRELIERSQFAPVQLRFKVYIIDECHMLSTAAFSALLKTLEEPPDRVVFVLATTDPQKVLPTISSRCQRFNFRPIASTTITAYLNSIATKEGIQCTPEALTLIAQIAGGGLRDAIKLLDQLSLKPTSITPQDVWQLTGAVGEGELCALLEALLTHNPAAAVDAVRRLGEQGYATNDIGEGLMRFLVDLQLIQLHADTSLYASLPTTLQALETLAKAVSPAELQHCSLSLKALLTEARQSVQPQLWLERYCLDCQEPTRTTTSSRSLPAVPQAADSETLWQAVLLTLPSQLRSLISKGTLSSLEAGIATLSVADAATKRTLEVYSALIDQAFRTVGQTVTTEVVLQPKVQKVGNATTPTGYAKGVARSILMNE